MNEEWRNRSPLIIEPSGARSWDNTNHLTTVQGIITAPHAYSHQSSFSMYNAGGQLALERDKKSIS